MISTRRHYADGQRWCAVQQIDNTNDFQWQYPMMYSQAVLGELQMGFRYVLLKISESTATKEMSNSIKSGKYLPDRPISDPCR